MLKFSFHSKGYDVKNPKLHVQDLARLLIQKF